MLAFASWTALTPVQMPVPAPRPPNTGTLDDEDIVDRTWLRSG